MWQVVAKLSEFPDKGGKTVSCAGATLALFRIKDKIFAIDDTCPHAGASLGEGHLDGKKVICPWHAWTFDVKSGACDSMPSVFQKTYPVKIDNEDILVDF